MLIMTRPKELDEGHIECENVILTMGRLFIPHPLVG